MKTLQKKSLIGVCKIENPFIAAEYRVEGARSEDIALVDGEITLRTSPGQKISLLKL